jgi:uncharacterized protein (TIGR04255 family)
MEKKKIYKNPPLTEAVFEIFFENSSWNTVIPGVLYSKIKEKYPIFVSNEIPFEIAIDNKPQQLSFGITQFRNKENGNEIIQIANNFLSVNQVPEYYGWDQFKLRIKYAVENLFTVIPDIKITKIGLRAINKIDIVEHTRYADYFEIKPITPDFKLNSSTIVLKLEYPIISDQEFLTISINTLKPELDYKAPVLFQIAQLCINNVPKDYLDWLENAHTKIKTVFESSLTESCKKSFDE